MSDLTGPLEFMLPPEGMQFTPADFLLLQAALDNMTGRFLDAIGGPDFLPMANPITVVPGTGMQVVAGGAGQIGIIQGRICDQAPTTNVAITAAGGSDRLDLIAVKAVRAQGSTAVTRNVRADNATLSYVPAVATLIAGTVTYALPSGYTVAPEIVGIAPVGTDSGQTIIVTSVSTTQVVFTSDDADDTRTFGFLIYGAPTGCVGVPTSVSLWENQVAWIYVEGSSLSQPATPAGYEAFATVYIHASETSIGGGDITYLFATLTAPIQNATFLALHAASLVLSGTLSVSGATTLAALTAAATVLASLSVTTTISAGGNISSGGHFSGNGSGLTNLLQSTDGSLNVTPGSGYVNNAELVVGLLGNTKSLQGKSGIVHYGKYFNYGDYEATIPGSETDTNFPSLPSVLGAFNHSSVKNAGLSGSPVGQTARIKFLLEVTPGAGDQVITGNFVTGTDTTAYVIALDGTNVATGGSSVALQTWSATIPDDSATHLLVLHFGASGASCTLNIDHGEWIPANASGGIDATKFLLIGPG